MALFPRFSSFAVTVAGVILAAQLGMRIALAHHSDGLYDQDRLITVSGTVTQFEFQNPHEMIYLDVPADAGRAAEWIILGSAPSVLTKVGWNRNSIRLGERLTISGFPFKDGRKGMLQLKVVRANGQVLPAGEVERRYLLKLNAKQRTERQ